MEFLNKWPNWLRWFLLVPTIAIAAVTGGIIGNISVSMTEVFTGSFDSLFEAIIATMYKSSIFSIFTVMGAYYMAPNHKLVSCSMVAIVVTLACGGATVLNIQSGTVPMPEFFASVAGILFGSWGPTVVTLKKHSDMDGLED